MERIRRVGCSAILSDLARKRVSEGKDEERMESMNVVPDTVVGQKEKDVRMEVEDLKRGIKATNVVPDKVVERKEETMRVVVSDLKGWENVDVRVGELVIASRCCNKGEVKEVDLCRFVSLRVFEVGDECFENVEEVKLIGLNRLERVVIGKNCFTKHKNSCGYDPSRHFYLKNCERVKELKMGCYSFNDYSVCEIENVPSLEMIEMGELNERSVNFYSASLELKSDCERMK